MDCHFHQKPGAGSAKDVVTRLEDEIKQGLQDCSEALAADISQAVSTAPELGVVLAHIPKLMDKPKLPELPVTTSPVTLVVDADTAIVPDSWEDAYDEKCAEAEVDGSETSPLLGLPPPPTPSAPDAPLDPPAATPAAKPPPPNTPPPAKTPPPAPAVAPAAKPPPPNTPPPAKTPPPPPTTQPPCVSCDEPIRQEKRVIFTNHDADVAKPSLSIRAKHYVQKKTPLGKKTTTILRNNPATYAIAELSERATDGDETYRWFWQAANCAKADTITTNIIDLVKGQYTHATEAYIYPELAELILGNEIFDAYRLFDEVNGQIKKNIYSGVNRLLSKQKTAYPDKNVFMATKCHILNQLTIAAYTERSFMNKPFKATARGSTEKDFHKGVRTSRPSPREPPSASGQ